MEISDLEINPNNNTQREPSRADSHEDATGINIHMETTPIPPIDTRGSQHIETSTNQSPLQNNNTTLQTW